MRSLNKEKLNCLLCREQDFYCFKTFLVFPFGGEARILVAFLLKGRAEVKKCVAEGKGIQAEIPGGRAMEEKVTTETLLVPEMAEKLWTGISSTHFQKNYLLRKILGSKKLFIMENFRRIQKQTDWCNEPPSMYHTQPQSITHSQSCFISNAPPTHPSPTHYLEGHCRHRSSLVNTLV